MCTQIDKESGPGSTTEATQFHQAQAGCPGSLNALMTNHDGLVQTIVRQQVLGDLPFSEALQAGRVGLWRAIQGFDPTRGLAFSTYAWPCIMRQVWREVKVHERFSVRPAISDVHISPGAAIWSTLPLYALCWLNSWAGPPPGGTHPSIQSPSSCSSVGRSPTNGTGPRPCATCVTHATPTTSNGLVSRTESFPPKAACVTGSPPSAKTRPPMKPL
jgi:hypothetical protein